MGEQALWDLFLEQEVEDLNEIVLRYGIHGLLTEFENWLYRCDIIDREQEKNYRLIKKA